LGAEDRRQLLFEFNQTAAAYPQDQCIHQLFEQQAARTPEQAAVVCEGRQLTYAELNARANQLAHYLRRQGVGAGTRVGLCVDRSVEMMVGLLGILKAGGAYVPLNPEYPKARLAQQLEEIEAPVVLTEAARIEQLPEFAMLCLDRDQERWATEPQTNPECVTTPEHPVYVIYTSGSTGVPKGVVVRHRGLVNYTHYIRGRLRLPEAAGTSCGWRFATVSTITADLGNTCIYPSLVSGGCLHILSYETATNGSRFASYVAEHPIDVLKIVPSHLGALLASQPDGANILPRKYLITGGEALSHELVERIAAAANGCELINHYGPTETTVGSLTANVSRNGARRWKTATQPIGRPIANTEIYILDEHRRPAPIGTPGELYIGGAGLAQGYLNQPERTAERFVAHPFSRDPEARLYKTGDLVRYLPDGQVEFLGRTDHQVKIRGYRIELEEIEVILGQHPSVRQAVVVAREEEAGNKRLVAYVVPNKSSAFSMGDLHRDLGEQLPDYMMPSAYVTLEALPLTANGKVDRKALPLPDYTRSGSNDAYTPPRNPTEELLVEIWARALQVEKVGIHDNFFSLGGHSLLAMKLTARIREVLRVELPLRDLFEMPTVAQLAAAIAKDRMAAPGLEIPPIAPVPRDQELPLSFSQQRLWFLDQLAPGNSFYNVSAPVRLRGDLDVAALERAIAEVIRRHEVLRTTYQEVEGRPVQVISDSVSFTLPVFDLSGMRESEREAESYARAAEDAGQPFDLARGPLFRVALLRLG
ncbi:MAG: amino acid adenylation domain-containing protein, partial [Anaerolineales bacterium]